MKPYVLIITMHADPAMPPGYGEWGGTHTYMRELMDCLDDNGTNCVLITRRAIEELPMREQYRPHCKVYRVQNGPISPLPKTDLIHYHEENLKKIQDIIEEQGQLPTVIHSVYWNSGRLGMELSKKYSIPLVHSVISNSRGRVARGAKEPMPERAKYEHDIYHYAKWILCVSEDEKNDLIHHYQVDSQKLIVAGQYIHSCFTTPARNHNNFPKLNSTISARFQHSVAERFNKIFAEGSSDPFWAYKAFMYFGRIAQDKGVDHILHAWHRLYQKYQDKCPPLWLVGGSIPEIEEMRKTIQIELSELAMLEHNGKLVWWGCLDPVGASTLLLKTSVLVTNSLYEPGGRVVTEAMCEGVPVIASPNGFAKDLIQDWENGFLVDHGDEDTLCARMEHFLRQPFLSDVLGRRAKGTAAKVITTWDFLGRHLQAYGIESVSQTSEQICMDQHTTTRALHLYPFGNTLLHPELIKSFFVQQTQQKSCGEPEFLAVEGRSEIYKLRGENQDYIVKRPLSCLSLGPLFVPVCQQQYAHTAGDRYRIEKAAYQSCQSNVLLGTDDFHQLFLLRTAEQKIIEEGDLSSINSFLIKSTVPLDADTPKLFLDILRCSDVDALDGIERLLGQLSNTFTDFYFAPSGIFLPYLGWRIAPHMLQYNSDWLGTIDMARLRRICDIFKSKTIFPQPQQLREINTDSTLHHIMRIDDHWEVFDREHRTIGTPENQVASFLFSLFVRDSQFSQNWGGVFEENCPEGCNYNELLAALSYRLFYDAVMHAVLRDTAIEPYLHALEGLMAK